MKRGFFGTLAVVGIAAVAAVLSLSDKTTQNSSFLAASSDIEFNKFMVRHGKSYATKEEYLFRKAIFDKAQADVNTHNAQNGNTWHKAINQFSDLAPEEIKRYLGAGHLGEQPTETLTPYPQSNHTLQQVGASYIDWRGQMNPVRNQGDCGSCWAFATVATTEGRYAIKYGKKVELSEQ